MNTDDDFKKKGYHSKSEMKRVEMNGPREWFIGWPDGENLEEVHNDLGGGVRVIEYSAYEKLRADYERQLTEYRESYDEGYKKLRTERDELRTEIFEWQSLEHNKEIIALQLQFTNSNWPHEKKLHELLASEIARAEKLAGAILDTVPGHGHRWADEQRDCILCAALAEWAKGEGG